MHTGLHIHIYAHMQGVAESQRERAFLAREKAMTPEERLQRQKDTRRQSLCLTSTPTLTCTLTRTAILTTLVLTTTLTFSVMMRVRGEG